MKINLAHMSIQGQSVAIFEADARNRSTAGRDQVLRELVSHAVASNLRVDKAALVFQEHGRTVFHGNPDLVHYLASRAIRLHWTHTIEA